MKCMKNGSLPNLPGTAPKLPLYQKDPTKSNTKVGIVDITKYKENVIKILQHCNKSALYWCTLNGGGENYLSALLGISQAICE